MDESKEGVVFFSLGSIVDTQTISEEFKNNILQVFASLKQTVIWKMDARTKNVPKNVIPVKWAPQQSILGKKFYFIIQSLLIWITLVNFLCISVKFIEVRNE